MADSNLPIDRLLDELRHKCGDSAFGYRMQGLFAHTIMRLGWTILAINAKGHPDILAQTSDDEVLIQVKSNAHRTANATVELSADDIARIKAIGMVCVARPCRASPMDHDQRRPCGFLAWKANVSGKVAGKQRSRHVRDVHKEFLPAGFRKPLAATDAEFPPSVRARLVATGTVALSLRRRAAPLQGDSDK